MALDCARDAGAATVVPPAAIVSANPLKTAKPLVMERGFIV